MDNNRLKGQIEAILFASGEPVELSRIASAIGKSKQAVENLLNEIADDYREQKRGIQLLNFKTSYQLATKIEYGEIARDVVESKRNVPLSPAALEILAVVAYNQPVSKSFVEQVRGVDSGYTVNTLCQKGLLEEAGRLDVPGKPIAYRTTANFLRIFDMKSLDELPQIAENEEE